MNVQEKTLARILFENKIRKSDGSTFENLFTQIMNYAEPDFEQIKPWGNIGDRKNDGFIRSKGIYYQVYAPEDIRRSYPEAIKKLQTDFEGLIKQWGPVKEFYFVVNDKYYGVNADANNAIAEIVRDYKLNKGKIITAKDLVKILFDLEDDIVCQVVGFLPDINQIHQLDYSVLNQVIGFIMKLPVTPLAGKIKFPEWNEKIAFNHLSSVSKNYLDNASFYLGALNEYLANENFLAEELQKHLIGIYEGLKADFQGDNLFWAIVQQCSPAAEQQYLSSVVTIMAKYFESCDIFEEPTKEYKNVDAI
jgi:hypothetical protein